VPLRMNEKRFQEVLVNSACFVLQTRYNKKKRGPYKEAIRQATCEARKDEEESLKEVDVAS